MWQLFSHRRKNKRNVAVLLKRDPSKEMEHDESQLARWGSFVESIDGAITLAEAIAISMNSVDAAYILVYQNARAVVDFDNLTRIEAGLADLESRSVPWAVAGGAGLGLDAQVRNVLYSSRTPSLPIGGGYHPVVDVFPDVLMIEKDAAVATLDLLKSDFPRHGFELLASIVGYLNGKVSLFAPFLAVGIDGDYLGRDSSEVIDMLNRTVGQRLNGETVNSFLGGITIRDPDRVDSPRLQQRVFEKAAKSAVLALCSDARVSIITRTRFKRNHLLRRLLASASRSRLDDVDLEIVIVSDEPPAVIDKNLVELRKEFPNLILTGKNNARKEHSRVGNLIEGISAAQGDYIMIVDDDDYLDPGSFESIRPAFFLGQRPVIFGDSVVHDEKWEKAPGGRYVLARSSKRSTYWHDGWKNLFAGVNHLPICSVIVSRDVAARRLAAAPLRYDLSEDYAFFLLLMTDPALPEIQEVSAPLCHISIRANDDNTVTQDDRSDWTHDISGFLFDIVTRESAGRWQVISSSVGKHTSIAERAAMARVEELEDQRRQLVNLLGRMKREVARLSRNDQAPRVIKKKG